MKQRKVCKAILFLFKKEKVYRTQKENKLQKYFCVYDSL